MKTKEYFIFWTGNDANDAQHAIPYNDSEIKKALHDGAVAFSFMCYEAAPANKKWPYIKGDWYISFECCDYPELAREEAIEFTNFLKSKFFLPKEAFTYWINGYKGIQIKILSKVFGEDNSYICLPTIYKRLTQHVVHNLRLLTVDWSIYNVNIIPYMREETFPYADGTYRSQIAEDALFRSTFDNLELVS